MSNNTDFLIEPAFANPNAYTLVFAPDNNYTPYFGVALKSLIINSKSDELYDIILFENDISERNKKLLAAMLPENFSLRFFNLDAYIKAKFSGISLNAFSYWSVSMYYRLFIPFIMQKFDRVMYVDSDVCFHQNIKDFYRKNFNDKKLIAVLDSISPVIKQKVKRFKLYKDYSIENPELYFNSGVLLFNIRQIDLVWYEEKLKAALSLPKLHYPDQDVLNVVFYGQNQLAEMKWNCQYGNSLMKAEEFMAYPQEYRLEYTQTIKEPAIIHYTTSFKPWHFPDKEAADIFWHYARLTPFYEEILFMRFNGLYEKLRNRPGYLFKYRLYKLLAYFTFGHLKAHYRSLRSKYKALLK